MATMLFVDIAAIYLISEAFSYNQPGEVQGNPIDQEEVNFNENNYDDPAPGYLQNTGNFGGDIGGDYGGGDFGGDD